MNGFGVKDSGEFFPICIRIQGHRLCGSGRFSNVYSGQLISPFRKEVAVKNVWSETSSEQTTTRELPEIQILSKLHHPAISNLLFFYTRQANEKIIHCLVLDFLPQDMAKLRDQGNKFDVLDAKIYTYQLFCAIAHLESRNIVHMDIKPANIILDQASGMLKLADFGNARRLETNEKTGGAYQVTRFYRPPELLFGCEIFTSAIDVWSAACVAFEFFGNRVLFRGKDAKDQMVLITAVLGYPTDEDIKSMGVRRPRVVRKTARGIETFTSKVLTPDIYEFLNATLKIDPKKRILPLTVLKLPVFDAVRATPRRKRSNGSEVPDLTQFVEMNHPRESFALKPPGGKSSSSESDKENGETQKKETS